MAHGIYSLFKPSDSYNAAGMYIEEYRFYQYCVNAWQLYLFRYMNQYHALNNILCNAMVNIGI